MVRMPVFVRRVPRNLVSEPSTPPKNPLVVIPIATRDPPRGHGCHQCVHYSNGDIIAAKCCRLHGMACEIVHDIHIQSLLSTVCNEIHCIPLKEMTNVLPRDHLTTHPLDLELQVTGCITPVGEDFFNLPSSKARSSSGNVCLK